MLKSNKSLLIFFSSLINRLEKFLVLFNVLNFFFLSVVSPLISKSKRLNKIWIVFFKLHIFGQRNANELQTNKT